MTMHDNAFEALANEHRREFLVALLEANPLEADVEPPTDGGVESPEADQRLQIEMYHTHLPKLVEYGFIEWEEDTNEIIKGPQFEDIRPLLEYVESHSED